MTNLVSSLLTAVRASDKNRVAKSGGVAVVISAGLQAAAMAGIALPMWAPLAGAVVGAIVYKVLPDSVEKKIDTGVDVVIDIATAIPTLYPAGTQIPQSPLTPSNELPIGTPNNLNQEPQ